MAFDEYRDRGRIDLEDEFRGGDLDRGRFRGSSESRWPGESSWGYGREYDEGDSPSSRRQDFGRSSRFESEDRPRFTSSEIESRPPRTVHYGTGFRGRTIGWQPQGGYGATSGYLYGSSQDIGLAEPGTWGAYRSPGYGAYYGASTHLANIPRGRFTGRGPKGYQRSDERIREDVSEELAQSGELDASGIEVRVVKCEVILEGEVDTREEKRLAEDIAEACPGVRDVENKIKVKKGFFARLFGTEDEEEEREGSFSARESR